jgi:hypothetical protein
MTMIALRILANEYPGNLLWIGTSEVKTIYDMIDVSFVDQVFSSKYLCYKYISRMLANHIKADLEEYTTLFKLIGLMPLEFFSSKTVLDDKHSRSST